MNSIEKFARTCDITGEGMNEGWCWGDGMFYSKYKQDTINELRKECTEQEELSDEELLEWACEEDILYWTEWYDEDDE